MIILREYKSVVFWLIFVSLWIVGFDLSCNKEKNNKIKEKENTSDDNVSINSDYYNSNINNSNSTDNINNSFVNQNISITESQNNNINSDNNINNSFNQLGNIINAPNYINNNNNRINENYNINNNFNNGFANQQGNIINVLNNLNTEMNPNNYLGLNQQQPILVGLTKIEGATCYMNAILQCLSNTKHLTEHFLRAYQNDNPGAVIANDYYEILSNLWSRENNKKAYNPESFAKKLIQENPLLAKNQTNKSKDLIEYLLRTLHQDLNGIDDTNTDNSNSIYPDQTNENSMLISFLEEFKKNCNSPISAFFYGVLETKIQCKKCNTITYSFNKYEFLDFPLKEVNNYLTQKGSRDALVNQEGTNPGINLYECFDYYRQPQLMTGEKQLYCTACGESQDTSSTSVIYSTPNYLIINLDRGKEPVCKGKVNFPTQLDIDEYVPFKRCPRTYDLYAVICNQLEPDSTSDKIVAYCKNRIDNKWYCYNDEVVSECEDQQEIYKGMSYMLFYEKV